MCARGGGRNKEPSKHGESVSSKAHKYSSRVLISPTHTRARRNTARAPAATPLQAEQQSPKLLLQTVQDCKEVGAAGGPRAHSHTPWGKLKKGPPPGTLCADPVSRNRRRRARVPRVPTAPSRKNNCEGLHERRVEGKPRRESCTHPFLPPLGQAQRRSPLQAPPVKQNLRQGAGRRTRVPGAPTPAWGPGPPTWWRASSTASASGRL